MDWRGGKAADDIIEECQPQSSSNGIHAASSVADSGEIQIQTEEAECSDKVVKLDKGKAKAVA
jgi:hypothetical protein